MEIGKRAALSSLRSRFGLVEISQEIRDRKRKEGGTFPTSVEWIRSGLLSDTIPGLAHTPILYGKSHISMRARRFVGHTDDILSIRYPSRDRTRPYYQVDLTDTTAADFQPDPEDSAPSHRLAGRFGFLGASISRIRRQNADPRQACFPRDGCIQKKCNRGSDRTSRACTWVGTEGHTANMAATMAQHCFYLEADALPETSTSSIYGDSAFQNGRSARPPNCLDAMALAKSG